MTADNATEITITRLFSAYSKQGISKHKAIMLIAASLSMYQKDVLDVIDKAGPAPMDNA